MINTSSLLQLPTPVLTVYLDTNPGESENQGRHPAYRTWLKDEAKLMASEVPASERRLFREQIERVDASLRNLKPHQRALLLFAGPRTWEEFPVGLPLQSELHWGAPAVSQLIAVMNDHKPCCIVAVDRAIFSLRPRLDDRTPRNEFPCRYQPMEEESPGGPRTARSANSVRTATRCLSDQT